MTTQTELRHLGKHWRHFPNTHSGNNTKYPMLLISKKNNKRNYVNRWAQSLGQSTWQVRHFCRGAGSGSQLGREQCASGLNRAMDRTIPVTNIQISKGLGKGLMTIAHVLHLISTAEQRIPSIPKDWNHLFPSHIKDVFMVNACGLGGSTGFGWKKPSKRSAKMSNPRKSSGRCKTRAECTCFTSLYCGIQTEF